MERIAPIDLERVEIPKRWRGLDEDAVRRLLQAAASEIELLRTELQEAEQRREAAERDVEHYRNLETSLQDALVLASQAADDTRANAYKEAELIKQRAEQEVAETRRTLIESTNRERWQLERLRSERQKAEARLREFLAEVSALLQGDDEQPALVQMGEYEAASNE